MKSIEKMVCVSSDPVNCNILTLGKVYEVTTEKDIDPFLDVDLTTKSFIGDDGIGYLMSNNQTDFMKLEDFREMQLNKII